jgi:hypothetical protein
MADKLYYHEDGSRALRGWVLAKMMEGAGYAALGIILIATSIWVLALLGRLLPEESRQTPDPTPTSAIILPAGPTETV